MPTRKQLRKMRESDFEFGLNLENNCAQNLSSSQTQETNGTVIGTIAYDPEKKDLKVTVLKDKKDPQNPSR